MHNQLQYQAVVLALVAGMGKELLVVEPDACPHGLADEVHGETGGDALPVVVPLVHSRLRQLAVAVGRDGIVAQGQRNVV